MEEKKIRLLKAGEIECRIGMVKGNGLSLLLYKDARADMKILDEVFGVTNWQRRLEMIGGSLYCTVSIWDEGKKQWIEKSDVGTESYTEKEKGQASDSFKRACVSLGIGRELYTAPFIWIPSEKASIQQNNGKFYCNDRFTVGRIGYNEDREISELAIVNTNTGVVVYEKTDRAKKQAAANRSEKPSAGNQAQRKPDTITSEQLGKFNAELARTGVQMSAVRERYAVGRPEDMSEEMYGKVMHALSRTKSANAA